MSFLAEVPYVVPLADLHKLSFWIENKIPFAVPQFPGMLCMAAGFTPRVTLKKYKIVTLHITDFYKDDGT